MLHGTFAIGMLIDVNVILCNIKLIGLAIHGHLTSVYGYVQGLRQIPTQITALSRYLKFKKLPRFGFLKTSFGWV